MATDFAKQGKEELRAARRQSRGWFWLTGLFSLFANLLLLTGPLYMMQVYDGVLSSGSQETLVALSGLVLFFYVIMGILDFGRTRMLGRVGYQFYQQLEQRVFHAVLRKAAVLPNARTQGALTDLNTLRQSFAAPYVMATYDLPWTPVFFAAMFLFHPLLGLAGVAGAAALFATTWINQRMSRHHYQRGATHAQAAQNMATLLHDEADFVRASGMPRAGFARWHREQQTALAHETTASEIGSGFSVLTKTLRLFLQSAMLGLAAWLVIQGQMSAGGMIAASVVLGRALAPIETLLNQWASLQQGIESWNKLAALLGEVPKEPDRIELPQPRADLEVKGLTVVPPGERTATLKSVHFNVKPGEALGVIGPSGAGKSSLARALAGLWPSAGGHIRLDGAALDQYAPEVLGKHIGYLPQQVVLFDGTIAENIARLEPEPNDTKVVAAAQMAGAHEMILGLPKGYDTYVRAGHLRLSGGQLQRIGLARALYHAPVLVILDEPNSNLDSDGSKALNHAIKALKQQDRAVLIMAHRPAAIRECDKLLVLENGMRTSFGPRDQVLNGLAEKAKPTTVITPDMADIR